MVFILEKHKFSGIGGNRSFFRQLFKSVYCCDSLASFTLSGTGSLSVIENGKALVRNGTILLAYPTASGNVTMNTITALDGKAFYSNKLTGINFPQVTSIGSEAFSGCSDIQDVNFPLATSIGSGAFASCGRLQSASFPLVTTISSSHFTYCSALQILNIPKVTNFDFDFSRNTSLSIITMGAVAPTTLKYDMFSSITTAKTVRVKVPSGATGYTPAASPFAGTSVTVSGTNTAVNWANGFRGGGWNGYAFDTGSSYLQGVNYINQNISLIIEQQ